MSVTARFRSDARLWVDTLESGLSRCAGFRVYVLAAICAIATGFVVVGLGRLGLADLQPSSASLWSWYVAIYWTSHPGQIFLFILAWLWLTKGDPLEYVFYYFVTPIPPTTAEDTVDGRLDQVTKYLIMLAFALITLAMPLVHLSVAGLLSGLILCVTGPGSLLSWWALISRAGRTERTRLGKYSFPPPVSFDVAGMGSIAYETQREIYNYEAVRGGAPLSNSVEAFLKNGSASSKWQGYVALFDQLSRFLQTPRDRISLHQNTTQAVNRALAVLVDDATHVLTTDLEFKSIVLASKHAVREDAQRFHQIELKERVMASRLDHVEAAKVIIEAAKQLSERVARLVVVVSHVSFDTGMVNDVMAIAEGLDVPGNKKLVLLIDGAQAVGNVLVEPAIFTKAAFYATSGHKWLLGKSTLGVLIRNEQILDGLGIDGSRAPEVSRPFSTAAFEMGNAYEHETIDVEPMISLNAMLVELNEIGADRIAEHNAALARVFLTYASRVGLSPVLTVARSGMVAVRAESASWLREQLHCRYNMVCQLLESGMLRFCFHYSMQERDVYLLLRALVRLRRERVQVSA